MMEFIFAVLILLTFISISPFIALYFLCTTLNFNGKKVSSEEHKAELAEGSDVLMQTVMECNLNIPELRSLKAELNRLKKKNATEEIEGVLSDFYNEIQLMIVLDDLGSKVSESVALESEKCLAEGLARGMKKRQDLADQEVLKELEYIRGARNVEDCKSC